MEHYTADGYPVTQDRRYWDSGLHQVKVTEVAAHSERNYNLGHPNHGQETFWHETTGGLADGSRLARMHPFTREDAWDLYSVIEGKQGFGGLVLEVGLSRTEAEAMVKDKPGTFLKNDGPDAVYDDGTKTKADTVKTFTVSVSDEAGNVIFSTDVEVDTAELPKLGDLGYDRNAAAYEAVTETHYWMDRP